MAIDELAQRALQFSGELDGQKKDLQPEDFNWYPYRTLQNFVHLVSLLAGTEHEDLLALAGDDPIADIGAADGDTAFFLESLGYSAEAVDNPPTNFNGCRGMRALKKARNSPLGIHEVDLDARFDLPGKQYGLAFFLGILYHLKNPFGAMESLARVAKHAVVSTRIARYNVAGDACGQHGLNSQRVTIMDMPVAYLVDSYESNNDPTNYWIFSEVALKRLFDRCGWDLLEYKSLGDSHDSDPASSAHDERAFCLLRSRHFTN